MAFDILIIALFLPLFPFSLVFNALYGAIPNALIRSVLLISWPVIGSYLAGWLDIQIPGWVIGWALATSVLYAFRLLAMREVGIWIGFLATSVWALLWLPLAQGQQPETLWYALSFNIPLALLALLVMVLARTYGAAYTELYGGLAQSMPRFSGIFVLTVLAATATPVFPSFFSMLQNLIIAQPWVAISLVVIWLLWSWASVRLLQGLIVGDAAQEKVDDLSWPVTIGFALVLLGLCIVGIKLVGGV